MNKEVIKRFYENVGNGDGPYNLNTDRFAPTAASEKIKEIVLENNFKCILDIGCGMGVSLINLAKLLPDDVCFVGIDFNESMIKRAKEKLEENKSLINRVTFVVAEADELPFKSNFFDLVFSECVFNLVEDRNLLINEVNRVLKTDGILVYSDFVAFKDVPVYIKESDSLACGCQSGSITLSHNIEVLENNFFTDIECINYGADKKRRKIELEESSDVIRSENKKFEDENPEMAEFLDKEISYYLIKSKKSASIPDISGINCSCMKCK
ncbi:Methyltransferase domain-containing protein [Clostridium cavendishii DSM 21758]|uniref:Methyltransferase domain-containing protein n=1 Tax=Clostridium cavendishii DSM 21758 TaxID=1121302 RepID=A0A1M6D7G1_9CLOT|nr:putative arsinothricin biosynthesis methyltransferase ArsM [Clostridium cavendishii]SHI69114.1 Methyltransferase domain-containing protein [Clostridium cavendishii DSM 21758]